MCRNTIRCTRTGSTLLELVLCISIMAVLAVALSGTMQASLNTYRLNQQMLGDAGSNTADWVVERVRMADRVLIQNDRELRLTNLQSVTPTVERIYLRGSVLYWETNAGVQDVASPVAAVRFSDPTGRGLQIDLMVVMQSTAVDPTPRSTARSIAVDWIRS